MPNKIDMMKIAQAKIEKAWENWIEFHYGIDCEVTMERFCRLIDPGDTNPTSIDAWSGEDEFIEVFPSIHKRITLLSGHNYHAFIKAWYVNNPWK